MLYIGALAGKRIAEGHDLEPMDPGHPVRTTVTAFPEGNKDVFRTHYAFFIAAAMVELVCVLLVASNVSLQFVNLSLSADGCSAIGVSGG